MSIRTLILTTSLLLGSTLALGLRSVAPGKGVDLQVFAHKNGDIAGIGGRAFLVDLVARFKSGLAATGASPELTGPGAHANTNPFPGTFSPGANADHFPGLVTLLSTTHIGAGPGQNVSNLFTIVAITDREREKETDVWSTWIIGDPNAFGTPGQDIESRLLRRGRRRPRARCCRRRKRGRRAGRARSRTDGLRRAVKLGRCRVHDQGKLRG